MTREVRIASIMGRNEVGLKSTTDQGPLLSPCASSFIYLYLPIAVHSLVVNEPI